MVLRVVLTEDSLLVREGVRRVLDREADLDVVATCADLPQLLSESSAKAWTSSSPTCGCCRPRLEVLEHIAQGKSNAAVAGALFLTERAVEKHINALFAKLGLIDEPDVNRRVKAVLRLLSERGAAGG